MLHAVTESLEADAGVVDVVLDDFILVKPTTVAVVELLGQIPVIKRLDGHIRTSLLATTVQQK